MKPAIFATLLSLGVTAPCVAQEAASGPPPLLVEMPGGKYKPNAPYLHFHLDRINGKKVLMLWGQILPGDAARFAQVIDMVKPIDRIEILASPGGVVDEGLEVGRIIRQNKLATHMSSDSICASSCNFVFMGGVIRQIDVGGQFITHTFASRAAPLFMLQDIQAAFAKDLEEHPEKLNKLREQGGKEPPPTDAQQPAALPQVSAVVGKGIEPPNLRSLGCRDVGLLYSESYDQYVITLTKQYEYPKTPDAELDKLPIKDSADYVQLRALAIDFLCLEEGATQSAAVIAKFLIDMRLSLDFLIEMANITHAHAIPLTRDQMRHFNVINME